MPGIAVDIDDRDGSVWALLQLLDGTRTVDQVIADLVHRFPQLDADRVRTDIDDLAGRGHLEDAGRSAPPQLTARDLDRHARSQRLWQWIDDTPRATRWHAQLALKQARVLLIGLGGAGSTAALALTQSGVGVLHCLDFDAVEMSNLNRQILYTDDDLGRSKVAAALDRLRAHNSDITITGEHRAIDGPADVVTLAPGFDVVLLAADRPREITSWVNHGCHATGTAWVHCGYHGPVVAVGSYQPDRTPCYDCVLADARDQRRRAGLRPVAPEPAPERRPPAASNAVTAGTSGLLAAHAVMRLITGIPAQHTNTTVALDLLTMTALPLAPVAHRPDCPTCDLTA
ncbi:ThiF family adenylyltransferase [Kutzneria buriramensis]|uniref:ThiF family adenylyltransferase n=1 Tax=Kutzneria buriramensis TaxID=1045776 RepID=UPI001FE46E1B|nr:ThiF family adenylyltransferase [Kutzneria buriramensis]